MRDDERPGRNPAWFDDLLEYEDRPLSRKLLIGVIVGLVSSLLFFGATLALYRPVTARPPAIPAAPADR
jgi:hypothetical protein